MGCWEMPIRWRLKEIVSLRAQLGLSQAEFGRRLGADQTTVSRWERGLQRPEPRVRTLLSNMLYEHAISKQVRPEVALTRHSPFPMAIITDDGRVIAASSSFLALGNSRESPSGFMLAIKKPSVDMEQALAVLRGHGFFFRRGECGTNNCQRISA